MDQSTIRSDYLQNHHSHLIYKYSDKSSSYSKQKCDPQYTPQNKLNLIDAAKENNLSRVIEILENGSSDLEIHDSDGHSPLYWACCRGNVDICRRLLEVGCDVNASGKNGATALMACADNGHESCLQLLLQVRSINLDLTSSRGDTAIHMAAFRGFPKIVSLLRGAGANADLKNINNQTPMEVAVVSNSAKCVNELTTRYEHSPPKENFSQRQHQNNKTKTFVKDYHFVQPKSITNEIPENDIYFTSSDSGLGLSTSNDQTHSHYSQTRAMPVCSDERLSLPDYSDRRLVNTQETSNGTFSLTSTNSNSHSINHVDSQSMSVKHMACNTNTKHFHNRFSNKDNNPDIALPPRRQSNNSLQFDGQSHNINSFPEYHSYSRNRASTISSFGQPIDRISSTETSTNTASYEDPNNDYESHSLLPINLNNLSSTTRPGDKLKKNDIIYSYNIIDNDNTSVNDKETQDSIHAIPRNKTTSGPSQLNIPAFNIKTSDKSQPKDSCSSSKTSLGWNMDIKTYVETLQLRLITQDGILQQERKEKAQLQIENYKLKNEIMKLENTIQNLNHSASKQIGVLNQ